MVGKGLVVCMALESSDCIVCPPKIVEVHNFVSFLSFLMNSKMEVLHFRPYCSAVFLYSAHTMGLQNVGMVNSKGETIFVGSFEKRRNRNRWT